jgi:Flp pilus assembly protein TadB
MNIKLKAFLITIAGFFGLFATLYAIAQYPAVLFFALLGGLVFLVYKAVLNYLEHNERFKK